MREREKYLLMRLGAERPNAGQRVKVEIVGERERERERRER